MADWRIPPHRDEESSPEPSGLASGPLMLDPSLLLARYTLDAVISAVKYGELRAVIPASFWRPFLEGKVPAKVASFFRLTGPALEPRQLIGALDRLVPFEPYETSDTAQPSSEFLDALWHEARDETVLQVLIEEWNFLNTHSWIASRIKRPFSTFVKAGAIAIEGGRHVLNQAVARTLKRGDLVPPALRPGDPLRASCKWLAVGGLSASAFISSPALIFLVRAAAGYFLLFDP